MVVDTQFHKFYGRSFARSIFIPHEGCRPMTPLGATRVNRTIVQRQIRSKTIPRTDTL